MMAEDDRQLILRELSTAKELRDLGLPVAQSAPVSIPGRKQRGVDAQDAYRQGIFRHKLVGPEQFFCEIYRPKLAGPRRKLIGKLQIGFDPGCEQAALHRMFQRFIHRVLPAADGLNETPDILIPIRLAVHIMAPWNYEGLPSGDADRGAQSP